MPSPPKAEKHRVAVLGGGAGALSAVWGLVNSPDADRYEISVYQSGWRLGGKARSGRNRGHAQRIEEAASQIWSGAFHNSFRMLRQVYRELERPNDAPLSAWYDPDHPERSAFLPEDRVALSEFSNGCWQTFEIDAPRNAELPGTAAALPAPRSALTAPLQWMRDAIAADRSLWALYLRAQTAALPATSRPFVEAGRLAFGSTSLLRAAESTARVFAMRTLSRPLERALAAAQALPARPGKLRRVEIESILEPLEQFARAFRTHFDALADEHASVRHIAFGIDLGTALVRGLLVDQIFERGFDSVDEEEFSAWFVRHGASRAAVATIVERGALSWLLASPDGDPERGSLSASSGLRTTLRTIFGYAGSIAWKMQAGAGDVVFAPLYQVLSRRPNVRFEFFHRVESLSILRAGVVTKDIQSIQLARQVDLRAGQSRYEPLYNVRGLPCWPSDVLDEQLDAKQAQTLREYQIDLESHWSPWPAREIVELVHGRDFDSVVVAIPPAELDALTPELREHVPGWGEMLDGLPSVATWSTQLWLDRDLDASDARASASMGVGYAGPFRRWTRRDELIEREDWGAQAASPRSSLLFCDAVSDPTDLPTPPAYWFPVEQAQRTGTAASTWLMANLGSLWPRACAAGSAGLDWSLLTTLRAELEGPLRFRDQHWQIQLDPSQRQLLSPPGTAAFRPQSDGNGIGNLLLAGDWLATGFNVSCFEAAVMGGLQASRAICGWPKRIVGEGDFIRSAGAETASQPSR